MMRDFVIGFYIFSMYTIAVKWQNLQAFLLQIAGFSEMLRLHELAWKKHEDLLNRYYSLLAQRPNDGMIKTAIAGRLRNPPLSIGQIILLQLENPPTKES